MIEESVFTALSGFAGLTALVPSSRITPRVRRQGQTRSTAVTYWKVSDTRQRHTTGDGGFSAARIQVDAYAPSYSEMKAIQTQVRLALEDDDGVGFRVVDVVAGPDEFDEETREHFGSTDFLIWHAND